MLGWLTEQWVLSTQDLLQLRLNLCLGRILFCLLLLRLPWRRLEILSQVVVVATLVARDLNGKELDLDGDASVLLAVVFAAVQSEQTAKAVVLQVLPALTKIGLFLSYFSLGESNLPKFSPFCFGFIRFYFIL